MFMHIKKQNRLLRSEESVSRFINIVSHYDADTLLDKSGKLIKIMKLTGLDFVTQDEVTLDVFKNRRNSLLKSLASEYAFYFWEVRRKVSDFTTSVCHGHFAESVNQRYFDHLKQSNMYRNELYIAIMTKPAEGLVSQSFSLMQHLLQCFDKTSKQSYLGKRHQELNDVTKNVLSTLADYDCELLGVYEKNGSKFSSSLEFLGQLVNFDRFSVPLEISDPAKILPRKRLFFNGKAGAIEMRAANGSRKFSAMLSIKAYSPVTYQGILDELSSLPCEYTLTQSFRFFDRQVAKTRLRDQQKEMLQTQEESLRQTDQIDDAYDDAASGDVGYGLHHLSLACFADSQEELQHNVSLIVSRFSDLDIACVREDIACECTFWAQLPGNFGYIVRGATISTKNMAALASLHNYPVGRAHGNHWGEAVTIFETLSGSPFHFNFHYRDVGNFLVFGAMGSGKTVLIGFLILQSMRFGGKRIIFDKDRGLEIMVRAMGGTYEGIKPGLPTGFNPCQLEDTTENRHFLSELFKKILTQQGEVLKDQELDLIENAVAGLYRLEKSVRQFCHIASFFGAKKAGSLRHRFDQWHSEGPYAWLFDNTDDSLNLNADVLGFDLGHILNHGECKTPALMYLTYRVEKAIEGQRGILFCDEGWRFLNDEYFKKLIEDWSRTPRKKNNIFGLATQTANDTNSDVLSKAINESAYCKFFFPNSSADRTVFVDGYGLSDREYELVKTLPDDKHYFLLTHGRGQGKQSVVLRLNLGWFKELIAIISARENTLLLLDQIIKEVGTDPMQWLPIFKNRLGVSE